MRDQGEAGAMTRREVLGTLGALSVAAAAGTVSLTPRPAAAQALGQNESVEAALKRVFGGRPDEGRQRARSSSTSRSSRRTARWCRWRSRSTRR